MVHKQVRSYYEYKTVVLPPYWEAADLERVLNTEAAEAWQLKWLYDSGVVFERDQTRD